MKLGVYVLGVAAIATGLVDFIWGAFEPAHEPIQAWGDNLTGRGFFVDVVAFVLILGGILVIGGAALRLQRATPLGALLIGVAYFIFAVFWAPRIYWTIVIPGVGWRGTIGVIGGLGQQAIVIAAAALLCADAASGNESAMHRATSVARWVFGTSTIFFGLAHLTGIDATAAMVPKWIPPSADFWVIFTGLAFVAAGIGIASGTRRLLAARLLTLMLLVFAAVVLAPIVVRYPHSEIAWGSNAYNLAAVGAAWVLADWFAGHRELGLQPRRAPTIG